MPSRWAETAEDAAEDARLKAEKEAKKRAKAAKQLQEQEAAAAAAARSSERASDTRAPKRRRLSNDDQAEDVKTEAESTPLLRFQPATWQPSNSITTYETLNAIEEGAYGHVSRARHRTTGEIVALKKLKLDPHRDAGFSVTALREIQTLTTAKGHAHIVGLREVVVGSSHSEVAEGRGIGQAVYLVLDFVEHDLKSLMSTLSAPFTPSETKTLMLQLCSAVDYLHENWILHRDLKTSNMLLNNRGELKLADFGMARFVGSPAPENLTQLVVTLWYRAPELLLGAREYGEGVDVWSLGCVFGELICKEPLLQGKNEVGQLGKIFELRGLPTEDSWPGFRRLPNARSLRLPFTTPRSASQGTLRARFPTFTPAGLDLLSSLLSLDPTRRPSAKEVLEHEYFTEAPRPKAASLFPTFPSKAGLERRRKVVSPDAPVRGEAPGLGDGGVVDFGEVMREDQAEGRRLRGSWEVGEEGAG